MQVLGLTKQSFIHAFFVWFWLGQPVQAVEGDVDTAIAELWLQQYGFWAAVSLALVAVVIRRMQSLLGLDRDAKLRRRAAGRILSAMCYVATCDSMVGPPQVALIADTARRLTGRTYPLSEIRQKISQNGHTLTAGDYASLGHGLRDHEKDVMLRAVLSIAMASGRIFPQAYEFTIALAHGLGIPASDFRRVLALAIEDMNTRGM